MVELLFVWIRLCVRFANAFSHDLGVATLVACVFAVLALHTGRILEKLATQGAAHDGIKLLSDEFVAILLRDLFLALSHCTFTI